MKVKSDNKKSINWSKYKPTMNFSNLDSFLKTWLGAWTILIICWVGAYYVWDYDGLLSVILWVISGIFLTSRKDDIGEKIGFSIFLTLLVMWIATADMITVKDKVTTTIVKYEKIEYIDSTEKIIIHAKEPINKVIVVDSMSSEQYYTVKGKQDLNVSILYEPASDWYDYKNGEIGEHQYNYVIKDGVVDWKSRRFEKDEKWF
jgi:hypothetical protein